jgi:hypothetical protein
MPSYFSTFLYQASKPTKALTHWQTRDEEMRADWSMQTSVGFPTSRGRRNSIEKVQCASRFDEQLSALQMVRSETPTNCNPDLCLSWRSSRSRTRSGKGWLATAERGQRVPSSASHRLMFQIWAGTCAVSSLSSPLWRTSFDLKEEGRCSATRS